MLWIANKTSQNFSSMYWDIQLRRKTEINYLNGKVVEIAKKIGMEAPLNQNITNQIQQIEKSWLKK